jgi:NADPH:quinone reductase-like Zn-dependent oxidoreductase
MSNKIMKVVHIHEYGGLDKLVLDTVARPNPDPDQVLIRVIAAGVNPADWKMRAGYFKEFIPLQMPWTPGIDAAGIIDAVGENVTAFQPGQAVFGVVAGGYAEYAVANATDVQVKPKHLTFEEAASVPLGALTAWGAVIDAANVQKGQRVLVHGGAGGVGSHAVQLAKWKGANVIATASTRNVEVVKSLGADTVIDYTTTQFENVAREVDAVIDTVGRDLMERSFKVLKPNGIFVTVAAHLGPEAANGHNVRAVSAGRASLENLKQIAELLETKKLVPIVGARYTLEEARRAQELSQTGHGRGRIVLLTA